MDFTKDGITFTIPDEPTIRQIMRYDSEVESRQGLSLYERLWAGVCAIAQDFTSDTGLELSVDVLDNPLDQASYENIKWASLAVFSYILDKKQVPKN
jgi:hypothetical protein